MKPTHDFHIGVPIHTYAIKSRFPVWSIKNIPTFSDSPLIAAV